MGLEVSKSVIFLISNVHHGGVWVVGWLEDATGATGVGLGPEVEHSGTDGQWHVLLTRNVLTC